MLKDYNIVVADYVIVISLQVCWSMLLRRPWRTVLYPIKWTIA